MAAAPSLNKAQQFLFDSLVKDCVFIIEFVRAEKGLTGELSGKTIKQLCLDHCNKKDALLRSIGAIFNENNKEEIEKKISNEINITFRAEIWGRILKTSPNLVNHAYPQNEVKK